MVVSGCCACWTTPTSGSRPARALDTDVVRARNPGLVVLSITDFGLTGPYRDWVATDWTLLAMGGVLSRSGLPGREPLMPPGDMALQVTAMQATWAALVAYWNRLESGRGDHIDFSLYEATAQAIDPAMGTVGTAQVAGYAETRDRPAPGPYPIFRCRDGHVRVVLLAPRQWHAMRAWLGEPEDLQDPELETIRGRALASDRVHAAFEQHFRERDKHELTLEGQARGVPIAPVLTPADVLAAEHFRARGAIARTELARGIMADAPTGFAEIDGCRVRSARRAPELGEHDDELFAEPARGPDVIGADAGRPRRPLEGLRVLDFGVIVLGAEVARLFCDQGAEVIKIESRAFPDGARVSPVHFAIGHRGSRGLGVNLRTSEGVDVIKRLVARSDVVLANFKPGTLDKLGLGAPVLREINPGIVVVNSSAVGATGPWSTWMGYGPLVRCVSGLTSLWRYPEDDGGFSDSTTIHPDHYAARVTAITALAALIGRRRSGRGAEIATSQAEAILMQIGGLLVEESLRPGAVQATVKRRPPRRPLGDLPVRRRRRVVRGDGPRRRRLGPPAQRTRRSRLGAGRGPRRHDRSPRAARRDRRAPDGLDARAAAPRGDGGAAGRGGAGGLHAASRRIRGRSAAPGARLPADVRAAGPRADGDRARAVSLRADRGAGQHAGARAGGAHPRDLHGVARHGPR